MTSLRPTLWLFVLVLGLVVACGEQLIDAAGTTDPRSAEGSGQQWGPLAIVDGVAGDEELLAGSLAFDDGCIVLDERGHRSVLLAWPSNATRWSDSDRTLTLSAGDEVQLREQDRVTLSGVAVADPAALDWAAEPSPNCGSETIWYVVDVTEVVPRPAESPVVEGPIGGGLASGTGTDVDLVCPDGVDERTEEWSGPAVLSQRGAVDEAFGDLIVGWIGDPFEIESAEAWASWGLEDDDGNLVAVATVVVSSDGWDPSHARYCAIPEPAPPPPPFTLHVSNQSFEDSIVGIVVTIDDTIIIDQEFDVEGQHNWISFEPDVGPGQHTLTAVSSTGAEFATEFTLPESGSRFAVLDYWFYPGEGPRSFTFTISDEPIGFG